MIGIGGAVGSVFVTFAVACLVCDSLTDVSIETYKVIRSAYNEEQGLEYSKTFEISEMGGLIVVRWNIETIDSSIDVEMPGVRLKRYPDWWVIEWENWKNPPLY